MSALGMEYESGICQPCCMRLEGLNRASVFWVLLNLVAKPPCLLVSCDLIQQTFVVAFCVPGIALVRISNSRCYSKPPPVKSNFLLTVNQSNMATQGRHAAFYPVTQGSKLLLSCSSAISQGQGRQTFLSRRRQQIVLVFWVIETLSQLLNSGIRAQIHGNR